jgi:hypothetical protein
VKLSSTSIVTVTVARAACQAQVDSELNYDSTLELDDARRGRAPSRLAGIRRGLSPADPTVGAGPEFSLFFQCPGVYAGRTPPPGTRRAKTATAHFSEPERARTVVLPPFGPFRFNFVSFFR